MTARVERVLHLDAESGFCVFVAAGKKSTIGKVVGTCPDLREGLRVTASGGWERVEGRGLQFRASAITIAGSSEPEAVTGYLADLGVPGIGEKTARKLVEALGPDALEILESDGDVPRIKGVKARLLVPLRAALRERRDAREVELQLQELGLPKAKRGLLRRRYGSKTAEIVRADPWRPARDVPGFGFRESLRIADKLGIPADDPRRVRGGFDEVLTQARLEGHCGVPRRSAIDRVARLSGQPWPRVEAVLAEAEIYGTFVRAEVDGVSCIFPARLAAQEEEIAAWLKARVAGEVVHHPDLAALVQAAERDEGLVLSDSQRAAVTALLQVPCGVLTGGPGVGKSTSTRVLVRALEKLGVTVALAAPTGRAAKRLEEATGREAATVHRTLGANGGGFQHDAETPLDCGALVLDEVSMMDVPLTAATLAAVPDGARVIFIGDADQLPSVGPGRVLGDMIASGALQVARLTEIRRQAARDSRIVALAHAVNRGEAPDLGAQAADGDLFVLDRPEADVAATVVDLVTRRLPGFVGCAPRDIQVLAPMRRQAAGVEALNADLQAALNPAPGGRLAIRGGEAGVGDKVIQTVNDYERGVRNGDIGVVRAVNADKKSLTVRFPDDGVSVTYDSAQLSELELAYALTVHKSQGGEYPVVVLPLVRGHRHMLRRNLLYTALTRGKQLVVLVGERALIGAAAQRVDSVRRVTRLQQLLSAEPARQAA